MEPLGVIFDMDGVLVDSYQAHFSSWNRMLEDHGLEMSEKQFAESFGRTSREIIRENWPDRAADEQTVARWDQQKEAAYREILREDFPAMKSATALLKHLDEAGFRLAVGSSGPSENVQVVLDCLPGASVFAAAVTGNDVSKGKPDPEVFLQAAKKLGVPPKRCVVVEDAIVGLQAANRAGMVAVGLTGTTAPEALAAEADLVIASLNELTCEKMIALIGQNNKPEDI